MSAGGLAELCLLASITGFTTAFSITDTMTFGGQVKLIIAIFTLDENQYYYLIKSNPNEIFEAIGAPFDTYKKENNNHFSSNHSFASSTISNTTDHAFPKA